MTILPAYLELVQLLSSPSTYSQTLSVLSPSTITSLLPYLPLQTLLKLPEQLLGSTSLSDLIDFQRDWVVSEECPKEMRDSYFLRLFEGEGGGKGGLNGIEGGEKLGVKDGLEYVLKAEEGMGGKVCESLKEFEKGLEEMSNGLFKNLDWSNVCLGGGSVLALLEGKQDDPEFAESDFDLFLYGLKPDELIPKVASVISQLKSALPAPTPLENPEEYAFEWESQHKGEPLYILGFNAISIIPPLSKNRRPIQIILHTNETIFDAVAGFDLDCCCFAYTGKDVVAVPRALRAFKMKTNLLDEKLARKIDPTASTLSSRALKYLSRGYSLALSPSSSAHLSTLSISLSSRLTSLTSLVSTTSHRVETPTDSLKGLDLLMRKKWNRDNKEEGEDGFKSDYGPVRNSAMKVVDGKMLKGWENGLIAHEFWENQVKVFQDVVDFIAMDKKIVPSKKVSSSNVSTYLIPYVCGFDHEFLLGLKDKVDDKFPQTWSTIRNLQYIVRLPKSLLPLIEKGENDFNETIKSARSNKTPSNSKKSNTSSISTDSPNFTSTASDSLRIDLDKVKALSLPLDLTEDSSDIYPAKSTTLKPRIPSFSGLYKPKSTNTSPTPLKFLQSLTSRSSGELGTTSTAAPYVYKTFTLSSLLQFRNLSPTLDQAKDLLYLLYSSLVRAAVSEPQGIPPFLFPHREMFDDSPFSLKDVEEAIKSPMNSKEAKECLLRYLAQPTKKQVETKFEDELKWIEKLGKKLGEKKDKGEKRKLGELDGDRKRWLEQWVKGEIMV